MGQVFTKTYVQVMFQAAKLANQRGHNVTPAEMLLIASHAPTSMAFQVLKARGCGPEAVLGEVQAEWEKGGEPEVLKGLTVLQNTLAEAKLLKVKLVGTECLLLGLLATEGCSAAIALARLGFNLENTRDTVRELFSREGFVYPEVAQHGNA